MRVLIAAYGSAGDLFPTIPVADHLFAEGHETAYCLPRALGNYTRRLGRRTFAYGDGSELRVLDDPALFTTRFDGWSSWRRTATDYVAPRLSADVAEVERVIAAWSPTLVVATDFAVAARVAALRAGLPLAGLSIYPQWQRLITSRHVFAHRLSQALIELVPAAGRDPNLLRRLCWGVGPNAVLLHDPVLLGENAASFPTAVGFPYWDSPPGDSEQEIDDLREWLSTGDGPAVLVTLGSFIGVALPEQLRAVTEAVVDSGLRAVVIGARLQSVLGRAGRESRARWSGFLPLSQVVTYAAAVVHHGGVGTTFGCLAAGLPSLVIPQAFDQCFNARLLERVGAGMQARGEPRKAVRRLVDEPRWRERATGVAAALVPSTTAAAESARLVLGQADVSAGAV